MAEATTLFTLFFVVIALIFIAATVYLLMGVPRLLENTVLGLVALLIINYFGSSQGFTISLNWVSVLVSAVFGLAGVGLLIILNLLGVKT